MAAQFTFASAGRRLLTADPPPAASAELVAVTLRARPVRESGVHGEQSCRGHDGPKTVALPARVTLGDFCQALAAQVALLDTSALRGAFEAFAVRHELDPETPGLRQDFMRLWAAFEATRDGGWWRLRWKITDREISARSGTWRPRSFTIPL